MYPVTDLVLRSYRGDFGWLAYALRSLHRHAKGVRNYHIIVPAGDSHLLAHLTAEQVHECPIYGDDYLGQQVSKLMADVYSDAEYILHWDSDTVLLKPMSPLSLMVDGKPIVYYEPYEKVGREPWQPIVTEVLGWEPKYEFMRRHPFMYPRWLHVEVRQFLEERHGMSLEQYITNRPYRSFSEFNVLGAYAYEKHRDKFAWMDPHNGQVFVRQFRSWDGLENHEHELRTLVPETL
jgi:hypothetical protein